MHRFSCTNDSHKKSVLKAESHNQFTVSPATLSVSSTSESMSKPLNDLTTSTTSAMDESDQTAMMIHNCTYFQPSLYDEVVHQWMQRPFFKQRLNCFLNIPVGFDIKIHRALRRIRKAGAQDDENLILTDMVSSKSANVLFSVSSDHHLKTSEVQYLNGTFVSKVFSGRTLANVSSWVDDMHSWVATQFGQHIDPERFYVCYPSKPPLDGKTKYVVFFVQLRSQHTTPARCYSSFTESIRCRAA